MNVAVVGGGAVGVTVASDLAAEGVDVTLYERRDLGAGSTGRAAGVCYDAFADRRDADLASRAMDRFRTLAADGSTDFPFEECPYVWLARDGDDRRADAIREQVDAMADAGLDVDLASPAELGARFPALRTDDVAVAGVAENGAHADPGAYVEAVGARARAAGAEVRTRVEAGVAVEPPRVRSERDREYDAVVVAAGAHTPGLLAEAGITVPVEPYRVQALVAENDLAAPICYDATGGFYVRPHPDGLLAGDGTEPVVADPDGYDRRGDDWFVEELRAGLGHRLEVDLAVDRAWAGLCTATPDRDPLIGEVAHGIYVATGFQGHGFMRAPAVGEAVAEQILGGEGIPGFDPERFDGDEDFDIREGMSLE